MPSALIIGAGISGIATAVRLSSLGLKVKVFERSDRPGGKIAEFSENGFRFDMGPSLFTMPEFVQELFEISGESTKDHFSYLQLETICRYFYEDGLVLDAYSDPRKMMDEFQEKTGEPRKNIRKFLDRSERLYELTGDVFIRSSLHELRNYLTGPFLRAFIRIYELDPFRTMHEANRKSFSDDHLVQLFDRYATYNGSDPYQAPATLNVIPHLEHNIGAYFPRKGMFDIVKSLVSLAQRQGVDFHYDEEVEQLRTENDTVKGIYTRKGNYDADIVVSSVDIHHLYSEIMPLEREVKKIEKHQGSSSALIFYWGVEGNYPDLDVHNILFSRDYKSEFEHLFTTGSLTDDPTVYIFISSKIVPTDAPPGSENWFVMVNAPENTGQNWDEIRMKARENILDKIKRILNIDIRDRIRVERWLDPPGIERSTSSYRGSLYGSSSNSMFAAFNRHPNRSRKMRGLYFTGGSVHPGGGIPLCLSSAGIVAGMIERDFNKLIL